MQISARLFIFVYQRVRRLPVYSILFLGAKHFRGHFVFAIYGSVCIYLIPVETSRPIIVTPGLQGAHSTHLFRDASLLASCASAPQRGEYTPGRPEDAVGVVMCVACDKSASTILPSLSLWLPTSSSRQASQSH